MDHVVRKALVAAAGAALLVGLAAGFASAAASPPNTPAITFVTAPAEGGIIATSAPTFRFTYNRTPKSTKTLTCTLSGPTPSSTACNPPTASGDKASLSGKSYSGLAQGSYALTVSLRLGDGGTASTTRHFTLQSTTAIAAGLYHSCEL